MYDSYIIMYYSCINMLYGHVWQLYYILYENMSAVLTYLLHVHTPWKIFWEFLQEIEKAVVEHLRRTRFLLYNAEKLFDPTTTNIGN